MSLGILNFFQTCSTWPYIIFVHKIVYMISTVSISSTQPKLIPQIKVHILGNKFFHAKTLLYIMNHHVLRFFSSPVYCRKNTLFLRRLIIFNFIADTFRRRYWDPIPIKLKFSEEFNNIEKGNPLQDFPRWRMWTPLID